MCSKADIHSEIKVKLNLPDYYGNNLDALWDCLTAWVEVPIEIEWKDYYLSESAVGEYAHKVLRVFQDADGINIKVIPC